MATEKRKITSLLCEHGMAESLTAAARLVYGEVVKVDGELITDPNAEIEISEPIYLNVGARKNTKIFPLAFDGKFLKVRLKEYGPHIWEVAERANAIVAVAQTTPDNIILVQQHRPAVNQTLYEVPAGIMEPWEHAYDTAWRELSEETGYNAGRIDFLFSAYSSPGCLTEMAHFYHLTDLTSGTQQLDPAEEGLKVAVVDLVTAFSMIVNHQITDMKTIAAISYLCANTRLAQKV